MNGHMLFTQQKLIQQIVHQQMRIKKETTSLSKPIRKHKSDDHFEKTQFKRSKSLQSLQTESHVRTIEHKCNYKLSTQHIAFLMEEERMKELHTIKNSPALSEYYETFNSVLLIIYKTSTLILTYMYYNNTHELNVDRLQVLNVLMGNFQDNWTQAKLKRIQILSTNLYEMAKNQKQFERRVQYVSRKLCNNKEKREKIEKSFLNDKLKKFWQRLTQHIKHYEKHSFIQEMFQSYAKKMCFYDIQSFIIRSLATLPFKEKIERFCSKQELDEDLNLDYTFEFLLLEEFSFDHFEPVDYGIQAEEQSSSNCLIM